MTLILRGQQLQPFADEHAATLFTDSLFAQYRGDIACPSCNVKNGLHLDQNYGKSGKVRRRYKHKCRKKKGAQHAFTMSCGNMLLNCIIPIFERCIERARDSTSPTAAATKATAQRYISLSLLACQRLKLEGARFDYHSFEERLQALVIHDTQLKAAVDAGLLLNDPRRRIASTQPPEVRDRNLQRAGRSTNEAAVWSSDQDRKELLDRSVVTRRTRKRSQPDRLDEVADDAGARGTKSSRRASGLVASTPPASEPVAVTSRSRRKLRTGVRASHTTGSVHSGEPQSPLMDHDSSRMERAPVARARTSRKRPLPPADTVPGYLDATLLTILTAVGARPADPAQNGALSISPGLRPNPVSACPKSKTRRNQVGADAVQGIVSGGSPPQQIHFHFTLSAEPLSLSSPAIHALLQAPQTRAASSRLRNAKLPSPQAHPMLANIVQADSNPSFRVMYLNVQGLTIEKWQPLFHAFQASQRSGHQPSLLLIAESHGPNREVREALAAEPFGWIKAMSGPSTRDGSVDSTGVAIPGHSSRRGGLLVVACPDVLVTIHRITPYCCTLSVLPPGTSRALLIHGVYLPPSMGHFEDWSLFKTFLAPSDVQQPPDLLLGDINVRFPTGNMEHDKSVGPKARLQVVEDCISKLGLRRLIASKETTEEAQVSSRVDHAFVKQGFTLEASLQFKQAMIKTDHPLMKVTLKVVPARDRHD